MTAARRLAAAALLMGVASLGGTAAQASAPAGGGARAEVPQRQATPQITLVDQTTWAEAGGNFDVRVQVTGAPAGATVHLVMHQQLSSRQAFTDSLDGAVGAARATSPPQPLLLDATGAMNLSYPIGDAGFGLGRDGHGVYPVSVVVSDPSGATVTELATYLVLGPDPVFQSDYPPLAVAVVVDIAAAPGLRPDGTVSLGDQQLARIADRVEILNRTTTVPLTVAPVPETLDALAEDPAAGSTSSSLARVVQGRQVLALPYVELAVDDLADAGLLNEVPPEIDAGAQATVSRLGVDPVRGVWLGGPISEAGLPALRSLGITRAIVPSAAVAGVPDDTDLAEAITGPVSLADEGPTALVADDGLATRLLGGGGRLAAQQFVAELAMIWALAPAHQRGVVVELPGLADLDTGTIVDAISSLSEGPSVVRPVTVDQMFSVPPPGDGEAPLVIDLVSDDGASDGLNGLRGPMARAQSELNGLAAMLNDSALIRALHRSLWIAPGRNTPDEARPAYVQRVDDTQAGLAAAINAPETFRITLTARDGTIPLSITNTSSETVRVRVHLASSQMEFPDGDVMDLDVPPGGERVDVDVRLRASGAFPLAVTITSPDGSIVLDRTRFTIRSTAISGVGLVLSIGAGLFLLVWWARHWRTARRSARLVPDRPPERPPAALQRGR